MSELGATVQVRGDDVAVDLGEIEELLVFVSEAVHVDALQDETRAGSICEDW